MKYPEQLFVYCNENDDCSWDCNEQETWNGEVQYVLQSEYDCLQERVQELETERRWIPVSERLPEDTRIYDVAIADYEYSWTGSCVFGKWIGESGKAILGVTHWKYRTQPPQESE